MMVSVVTLSRAVVEMVKAEAVASTLAPLATVTARLPVAAAAERKLVLKVVEAAAENKMVPMAND